jgi:hypothetical protein
MPTYNHEIPLKIQMLPLMLLYSSLLEVKNLQVHTRPIFLHQKEEECALQL